MDQDSRTYVAFMLIVENVCRLHATTATNIHLNVLETIKKKSVVYSGYVPLSSHS